MSHGYTGPRGQSYCRCCRSGPKGKFICEGCLHVCKAPHSGAPHCPFCRTLMRAMGDRWRPARKGKRTVPELTAYQRWPGRGYPGPGEQLLARLTGTRQ